MTQSLGAIRYGHESQDVFLGRDIGHQRDYSEAVAAVIDTEVRSLIDTAHHEAFEILENNRVVLDKMVVELLEKETLDQEDVNRIFTKLKKRKSRPAWTGSQRRQPSAKGPVPFRPKVVANVVEEDTSAAKPAAATSKPPAPAPATAPSAAPA